MSYVARKFLKWLSLGNGPLPFHGPPVKSQGLIAGHLPFLRTRLPEQLLLIFRHWEIS
nr:hypothetical protein Q903MT_gene2383 [Picea sitchensis]